MLKQYRGMGGTGVWKVEPAGDSLVRVQHAARDSADEELRLDEFVRRCEPYFAGPGRMIDQPFQERLDEGMIGVYLTHDRVVRFAHEYPRAFLPPSSSAPAPKSFEGPAAPAFQVLRTHVESEWVPELQRLLDLDTASLPVIWDIDFLFRPKTEAGDDSFVLCEINVCSTFAFPEQAVDTVAQAAVDCVRLARNRV